jgi:hypothetical protein
MAYNGISVWRVFTDYAGLQAPNSYLMAVLDKVSPTRDTYVCAICGSQACDISSIDKIFCADLRCADSTCRTKQQRPGSIWLASEIGSQWTDGVFSTTKFGNLEAQFVYIAHNFDVWMRACDAQIFSGGAFDLTGPSDYQEKLLYRRSVVQTLMDIPSCDDPECVLPPQEKNTEAIAVLANSPSHIVHDLVNNMYTQLVDPNVCRRPSPANGVCVDWWKPVLGKWLMAKIGEWTAILQRLPFIICVDDACTAISTLMKEVTAMSADDSVFKLQCAAFGVQGCAALQLPQMLAQTPPQDQSARLTMCSLVTNIRFCIENIWNAIDRSEIIEWGVVDKADYHYAMNWIRLVITALATFRAEADHFTTAAQRHVVSIMACIKVVGVIFTSALRVSGVDWLMTFMRDARRDARLVRTIHFPDMEIGGRGLDTWDPHSRDFIAWQKASMGMCASTEKAAREKHTNERDFGKIAKPIIDLFSQMRVGDENTNVFGHPVGSPANEMSELEVVDAQTIIRTMVTYIGLTRDDNTATPQFQRVRHVTLTMSPYVQMLYLFTPGGFVTQESRDYYNRAVARVCGVERSVESPLEALEACGLTYATLRGCVLSTVADFYINALAMIRHMDAPFSIACTLVNSRDAASDLMQTADALLTRYESDEAMCAKLPADQALKMEWFATNLLRKSSQAGMDTANQLLRAARETANREVMPGTSMLQLMAALTIADDQSVMVDRVCPILRTTSGAMRMIDQRFFSTPTKDKTILQALTDTVCRRHWQCHMVASAGHCVWAQIEPVPSNRGIEAGRELDDNQVEKLLRKLGEGHEWYEEVVSFTSAARDAEDRAKWRAFLTEWGDGTTHVVMHQGATHFAAVSVTMDTRHKTVHVFHHDSMASAGGEDVYTNLRDAANDLNCVFQYQADTNRLQAKSDPVFTNSCGAIAVYVWQLLNIRQYDCNHLPADTKETIKKFREDAFS